MANREIVQPVKPKAFFLGTCMMRLSEPFISCVALWKQIQYI
jgi:hypothetical protein